MVKKEKTETVNTLPSMDEVLAYLEKQSATTTKRDLARAFHIKGNDRIHLKKVLKDLKNAGKISGGSSGRRITLADSIPERVVVEITGLDSMGDLIARPLEWDPSKPVPQITITTDKLSPPIFDELSSADDSFPTPASLRTSRGEGSLFGKARPAL